MKRDTDVRQTVRTGCVFSVGFFLGLGWACMTAVLLMHWYAISCHVGPAIAPAAVTVPVSGACDGTTHFPAVPPMSTGLWVVPLYQCMAQRATPPALVFKLAAGPVDARVWTLAATAVVPATDGVVLRWVPSDRVLVLEWPPGTAPLSLNTTIGLTQPLVIAL